MGINIQTIKDIKPYFLFSLRNRYPETEISAITSIIIKTLFGASKLQALTMPGNPVPVNKRKEIIRICNELNNGKPLQYILGETDFYNCTIRVDGSTLIPRPETEELVDLIIRENKGKEPVILDVATGSGCIAIALAVNLPGASVYAFDLSSGAIDKAKENAVLNKAGVTFFNTDIFNPELPFSMQVDIIVCNPPYVLESEKQFMADNVLLHEPHSALFVPDDDPLRYYKAVTMLAGKSLKKNGTLWFEINEKMGEKSSDLLLAGGYKNIELINDINGKERILKGIKNE